MARKQRAEQCAEHRRQRDEEERRQRVIVITEFDAGDPPKEHAEFVAGTFIGAYTETPKNLVGFFAPHPFTMNLNICEPRLKMFSFT